MVRAYNEGVVIGFSSAQIGLDHTCKLIIRKAKWFVILLLLGN